MQAPAVKLPEAIVTLCDEHRYMNLLLETLEEELQPDSTTGPENYYLMQDIVTYLHEYSDVAHHPTEDLLFEKLVTREPASTKQVQRLRRDHEKLTGNTAGILELLRIAADRPSAESNEAVRIAIRAYAAALRKHMRREEGELFPCAVRCFGHADWRAIEEQLEAMEDPLFGQQVGSGYRVLYEYFADRADSLAQGLSQRGFLQLDNFIVSADALERGIGDLVQMLRGHVESIAETSRETGKRSFVDDGIRSTLGARLGLAAFIGKKAIHVGSDSAKLLAGTLKKMVVPFFRDERRAD